MADGGHDTHDGRGRVYDTELHLRSIIGFSVGVITVTLIAAAVMWWMSTVFKRQEEARDRAPPPLPEARFDPIPPGPLLQPAPLRDMDELRARDEQVLTTYGWVDAPNGVARIPVERAISILAEKGPKK